MRGVFVGAAAGAFLTIGVMAGIAQIAPSAAAVSADTYRQLSLFGDVFERVRADYVEPVDDAKMIDSAINGMLASLDPHSSYLNSDNFQDMQVQTRGEFGGLGIEVTMEEGLVQVVAPIDDTPASRAGILSGDKISHINGEAIAGLTLSEAVDMMRGPVNTNITVTILREGMKPFDVTLTRAVIRIRSVRQRMEGEDVGYIRITTFNEQTDIGLEKAIAEVKKSGGNKLVGYVLDLRNNPGGLLDQAIAVTDAFLERGEVVSTRGRREDDIQRYNARRGDLTDGKPVVVLINGGSASASEIVAGALQDHKRATLMGTRSFGKGSVQTIIPLSGGADGALRLTTARYFTPSGQSIQAKGIDPDIIVELPNIDSEIQKGGGEASLPNHLENGEKKAKEAANDNAKPLTDTKPAPKAEPEAEDGAETEEIEDVQLLQALEFLRSGGTVPQQRAAAE